MLIDTASSLGHKLRLKDYFIGSFLVGIGTSLPELFTSIAAVVSNVPQLVVPTIFGTITANVAAGFGLGTLALYFAVPNSGRLLSFRNPIRGGELRFGSPDTPKRFLGAPITFSLISILLTGLFFLLGQFGFWHAVFFLILYGAFFAWELRRNDLGEAPDEESPSSLPDPPPASSRKHLREWTRVIVLPLLAFGLFTFAALDESLDSLPAFRETSSATLFLSAMGLVLVLLGWLVYKWQQLPRPRPNFSDSIGVSLQSVNPGILIGCLGLTIIVVYYSGLVIVESLEWTAIRFGIGDTVLAASALAVGTSLPDIVVAIKVARAGRHMLLFGHILQSNTFDVLLVLGICGVISPSRPLIGPPETMGNEVGLSIGIAIFFTVCLIPVIWNRRFPPRPALMLVSLFIAFLVALFLVG